MQLEYDLSAGALYVRLSGNAIARTREIDDNTNVDLDAAGALVGIEVIAIDHPWPLSDIIEQYDLPDDELEQISTYFRGQLQQAPVLGIGTPKPAMAMAEAAA